MVGLPMLRSRSCISMKAPIQRQYCPLVAPKRGLLVEVGAGAERALAGPGHHHHRHRVVPRRVLEGARQLAQRLEVERVEHLGPVDRHGRDAARGILGVADALEAERGGLAGSGALGSAIERVPVIGDEAARPRPARSSAGRARSSRPASEASAASRSAREAKRISAIW